MARKRLLPKYVQWRDGRPRWELGGDGGRKLRAAGFRSIDLKDVDGNWLSFEQARAVAEKLNTAVTAWRDLPGSATQADLEKIVTDLPASQHRAIGDFQALCRSQSGRKTDLLANIVDAHLRTVPRATTRASYQSYGNVLKLWLGDMAPGDIAPSDARRWFETLLDVGYARDQAPTGSKGRGLDWHTRVLEMNQDEKQALRERRLSLMESDDDWAQRPPGYAAAHACLQFASIVTRWGTREFQLKGTENPFSGLGLASPKGRVRYIEQEELQHLVTTAQKEGRPRIALAAALALGTVQRRADVTRLTWRIFYEGRIRLIQQKTGTRIDAPTPKALLARLERHLADMKAEGLVPTPDARILDYAAPAQITTEWAIIRQKAAETMPSVADVLFHDLRDTSFTRMLEAGADLVAACNVSGHSLKQAGVIEKGYLARRPIFADRAVAHVDDFMDRLGIAL